MADQTTNPVYVQMARRIGYFRSKALRHAFELWCTPEEGQVWLEIPAVSYPGETPAVSPSAEEIAKKLNREVSVVQTQLENLFQRGLTNEVKTPEGHARYYAVTRCEPISNAVGYLFGTRDWDDKTRSWRNKWVASILDQMQDFEHHDWWRWQRVDELTNRQLGFGLGAGTFIIVPAWRALEKSGCELPPDYVHAGIIARNAEAQGKNILARPCICRIRMREKDCTAPVWTCVPRIEDDPTFGPVTTQDDRRAPNTATTRGQYKRLSPEEFLETWRIAEEDEAMIHIGRANGNYVCTCCDECCDWLTPVKKYVPEPSEAVDPSPFRSVVNKELCQGCPDCVARCQFKAIKIMAVDQSGYPVKDQDAGGLRKAVVDLTKCVGCGQCVLGCGVENALKLELATKINAPPPIWADRLATV